MNDWVSCNKCSQKFQPNIKFLLAECGHIFCERCALGFKQNGCSFCSKAVKMIEISQDMDSQVQQFFWPLDGLQEKFMKVVEFQSKHKAMFLQNLFKKYTYAKKECIHLYNVTKKQKQEIEMLRSMLKSAGINANQFLVTSTPAPEQNKSIVHTNLSMISSVKYTPRCGSAHRVNNYASKRPQQYQQTDYIKDISPAQIVPNSAFGYNVAPVHREHSSNLVAARPAFMEKLRKEATLQRGAPRKQNK